MQFRTFAAIAATMLLAGGSAPLLASERGEGARVGTSSIGPDDQLGRLSMMSEKSRSDILAKAQGNRVYDLAFNFFTGMPSCCTDFGDPPFQFWMTHTPGGTLHDDPLKAGRPANEIVTYSGDAISMYTHVGTHIDTLAHFGLHGKVWNGFEASRHLGDKGWDVNGADKIPPIIARGVLIDVARYKGLAELADGYRITAQDLKGALKAGRVRLAKGDVALIRTGRGAKFRDAKAYAAEAAGLTIEAAQYLAGEGAMIVGVDQFSPDLMPSGLDDNYLPVHTYLLGEQGIPIMENVDLEALSRDGVYEMAFIGTPLKIEGASGAPIRPIAMPLR
ncbi:MAG: cyclase family protein [Sphingosinicella sp.]|nr:cyclase family protein [Sphingosinicella sp.]